MKTSVNTEQKAFVIDHGDGVTMLGFENCDRNTRQLARLLGDDTPIPKKGTIDQYKHYQTLVDQARHHELGTWFSPARRRPSS